MVAHILGVGSYEAEAHLECGRGDALLEFENIRPVAAVALEEVEVHILPEEVKIQRLQRMIDLQNQLSEESNLRDVGKEFEVLVEGFSKRSREQLFGRTSQNKVVIFDKKDFRIGQFIRVRIVRASSATLFGEPV